VSIRLTVFFQYFLVQILNRDIETLDSKFSWFVNQMHLRIIPIHPLQPYQIMFFFKWQTLWILQFIKWPERSKYWEKWPDSLEKLHHKTLTFGSWWNSSLVMRFCGYKAHRRHNVYKFSIWFQNSFVLQTSIIRRSSHLNVRNVCERTSVHKSKRHIILHFIYIYITFSKFNLLIKTHIFISIFNRDST
jgi:hypothetical protein